MRYSLLVDGERVARLDSGDAVRSWIAKYREEHVEDDPDAAHVQVVQQGSLGWLIGGKLLDRERFFQLKSVSWNEARARRLARSHLTRRASAAKLVEVVREVCGIHAQVQAAAELSICARVNGVTQEDVRAALWADRTLVKTWTLRGTLHLHPADELPLWFAARRAVTGDTHAALDEWRDPEGVLHPALSADEVAEIRSAVLAALDGRTLLREELVEAVVPRVGRRAEGRLRSGFAFFLGETCQGPPKGNKITLTRPDQWLGRWQHVDETQALEEVCRRFLRAYGPSTPQAFREWFGAREFLSDGVEEIEVAGRNAFVLQGDKRFPKPTPTVRLLPEYDAYVMGFRERDRLVPEAVRGQVAAHGRGKYEGPAGVRFLMIDGVAAGLWERKKRARRIELHVTPSGKLTRAERAQLDTEAERIGAFLGLEPVLTVG